MKTLIEENETLTQIVNDTGRPDIPYIHSRLFQFKP